MRSSGRPPRKASFAAEFELYGVVGDGGPAQGAVYKLKPPSTPGGAWSETVLHSFGRTQVYPNGLLIGKGGVLYGTTSGERPASKFGWGTVFQLIP